MHYVIIFFASLTPFLAQFLVASTARIAVTLGFSTVAFVGIGLVFDTIIDKLNASTSVLSPHIATFITLLGIDTAINIMLSAGVFVMVLKGMGRNGDMRKTAWRKPGDKSNVDWGA